MSIRSLLALAAGLLLSFPSMADSRIMTSIKPIQQITAALLDGIDEPAVLLPPGVSPHAFALRPSDRRALAEAERIYWIGPDLERFLDSLLHDNARARELMAVASLTLREFDEEHAEHADEHHDHDHDAGSLDPHIWLSPDNALTLARWMKTDLAPLYPEQEARLDANLHRFEQQLSTLQAQLRTRFAPLKNKPYFVFHDGYGYLEEYLGIEHRGVFSLAHEIQPGARHVNDLREDLRSAGRACVFSEPQFTPRLIASLTEGLPVETAQLDPLGADIAVGADGYVTLLTNLTDNLAGCLTKL
ncbi:zinc ABC transporter substrate-binding protein ZnuA [Halopseudomonas aestusnigri]|uniref:High-affinity zinc uptake system protein ZnuA n=1 Tax=Halopseudomonas aestusnigri TaxID=857252 RepID=A0AAQ1JR62_9GAMM|nr:zinc ABC transporter substrate-binding protein ZnuA [Halopseudomonas aestusnigri]OWL85653.1 zinc ABC transporter substrate-binding protein [Halopseudomonas aestusnigri]SEG63191.1 zinc transport system substrate-binding protein [Halopseudomonas aestusnigri]